MKKLITITLIFCLVSALSACGNDNKTIPNESEIENENEQQETEEAKEKNEETKEEIEQEEYIENTDEQRENEPRDFINGFPLYIEFEEDFNIYSGFSYYHITDRRGRNIAIAYSGTLFKIELFWVFQNFPETENHFLGERIFNISRLGLGDSPFAILCKVELWQNRSFNAVVLTDGQGIKHTYFLSLDEDNDELVVEKVEALKQRRSNQSFIDMYSDIETVTVRFFTFCPDYFSYEYETEEINVANFTDEFIYYMFLHTGATIDDIWFEGNTICVDLNDYYEWTRFSGSTGVSIQMSQLKYTISSIPKAERIDFWLDGESDAWVHKIGRLPIYYTEEYRVD